MSKLCARAYNRAAGASSTASLTTRTSSRTPATIKCPSVPNASAPDSAMARPTLLATSRRVGLSLLLIVGQAVQATPAASEVEALHVINRLSFGPAPGDVARVTAMGINAYIDEQLHPERLAEPEALTRRLAALELAGASQGELVQRFRRATGKNSDDKEATKAERQAFHHQLNEEAATARLLPALQSPRQL
ncbi:MAG: DUF1800 family protein, partial [Betaproteobacteria bacterium]|nr:DUF1800 family protein [Betaproteobacteria bacterium]